MIPRAETRCAITAARLAASIARSRTQADVIRQKAELDIVTGTDVAVEDGVRAVLLESFPAYVVVGEERGGTAAGTPYWLVDPICGTQSFASRIPAFCNNIALVEGGIVTAAAVGDGATGDVYFAERGHGAFLHVEGGEPRRLHAAEGPVLAFELAGSPIYTGSTESLGSLFGAIVAARRWHPLLLGTTLPFARVATGEFAGMYLLGRIPSPLHTAAGCLLAEESGAVVSDSAGRPWNLETLDFIVGANATLHAELVALYSTHFDRGKM